MDKESSRFLNSFLRWTETYELSFELAEIVLTLLNQIIDYCKENHIPIHKETGIWNLMREARHRFKLIENLNSYQYKSLKLPVSFFDDRDPEDLPEPNLYSIAKTVFDWMNDPVRT